MKEINSTESAIKGYISITGAYLFLFVSINAIIGSVIATSIVISIIYGFININGKHRKYFVNSIFGFVNIISFIGFFLFL